MNRTTKALARLSSVAVIAGTVLSTPFALGTASAAGPTVTIDNGSVTTTTNAANRAAATGNDGTDGSITIDAGGDNVEVDLSGGNAYFLVQGSEPESGTCGTTTIISATRATLTDAAGCQLEVGDASADATGVTVIDTDAHTETDKTIKFSGLFFQGCSQTGIDGSGASDTSRCKTQGQTLHILTITVHYAAGGVGLGAQNLFAQIPTTDTMQFAASQPAGSVFYDENNANCTTDPATGNCSFNVVDSSPSGETPDPVTATLNHISISTDGSTGTIGANGYPGINNPDVTPYDQESVHFVANTVTPARVDIVRSTLISPTAQDDSSNGGSGSAEPYAEPGDVIQNIYRVYGGCTPVSSTVSCTGEPLAGISLSLAVDHGFFTNNCGTGYNVGDPSDEPTESNNTYANCSFSTAPTAGAAVGNIASNGATATITTDANGYYIVSIGIGRDAAFDNNGYVVATVTANGLNSRIPWHGGTDNVPTASGCSDSAGVTQPEGSKNFYFYPHQGCYLDVEWTTDETPLNGGTAKLVAVPRLTNPSNVFVNSENNYNVTDSGTNNIPDVGRAVYLVHVTDQFGNLTSNDNYASDHGDPFTTEPGGGDVATRDAVTITKTGVGTAWYCYPISSLQDFTGTNPCTGAGGITGEERLGENDGVNQADGQIGDGTFVQESSVVGSYLNSTMQVRFQSDAAPTASDGMVGCYAPTGENVVGLPTGLCETSLVSLLTGLGGGGVFEAEVPGQNYIGVDDGTQTVTLDWSAPTTTFLTFHAAAGGAPASATYTTGNAADAPDVYKLNLYNQLAAPVVTFAAVPGNSVPTSTAVTVTGTVVDQFGNGIVGWNVQFVRSGGNEASCTPIQNGETNAIEQTNQAGIAGYTFSCDAPGTANVSIVVVGPGGTQLASGREAVTFTGNPVKVTNETPTISLTSHKAGHLTVHIVTHPAVGHVRINIYRKLNGLYHLIGSVKTGAGGKATKHLAGLHSNAHYRVAVKAVGLGKGYDSHYSKHKSINIA